MDQHPGMAFKLLATLAGATAVLLVRVAVALPYRSGDGREGATQADKLQMLTLAAQIANYGLAGWCLRTQRARQASGAVASASGSYLSRPEEFAVAGTALCFVVAPLVVTLVALEVAREDRVKRQRKRKRKRQGDKPSTAETVPGTEVKFDNPLKVRDDDDEVDGHGAAPIA